MSIKYTQRGRRGLTDCVYTLADFLSSPRFGRFHAKSVKGSITLRNGFVYEARSLSVGLLRFPRLMTINELLEGVSNNGRVF
jgi:hypothetical protein